MDLGRWEADEDHPYGPQGAKPKRFLICPNPIPHSFLLGAHRYVFKEPTGGRAQQIWSEVIAYELGKVVGVPIPPAFLGYDPHQDSSGVLVEFFFGYQWEHPPLRFVHAVERLQGEGISVDFRRGSIHDNVVLTRAHKIPNWREWWAKTLTFDALIGNTDRHSENWGFLVAVPAGGMASYALAPVFDNGTSLGFLIRDQDLARYAEDPQLAAFLARGTHHCGWLSGDDGSAAHVALCARYKAVFGDPSGAMDSVIQLLDSEIEGVLEWCTGFDFPVPFSAARAEFVGALIKKRRDALAAAIGV